MELSDNARVEAGGIRPARTFLALGSNMIRGLVSTIFAVAVLTSIQGTAFAQCVDECRSFKAEARCQQMARNGERGASEGMRWAQDEQWTCRDVCRARLAAPNTRARCNGSSCSRPGQ